MRVSSFCCVCSLETGCKVIAILGLILGGLGFITAEPAKIISSLLAILAAALLLWGTL